MSLGSAYKTPIYRIAVDGEDITTAIQGRLISLTLTDNPGFDADQLDLVLGDSDGKLDLPPKGATITLAFGWQDSGLVEKGTFTVDEISHSGTPDTLTIRARSADLRAGMSTKRERSWHGSTVGGIIREIAEENELTAVVSPALDGQLIAHLDQTNESSANLLTRLSAQFDAIATVKNGKLMFIHAGGGVSASGKPLPVVTITRRAGDQHHFSIADRDAYTHVKALWHNLGSGATEEVFWGKAEDDAENNRTATQPPVVNGKYKLIVRISKSRDAARRRAKKTWGGMSKAIRAGYIGVKAPYNDRNLKVSGEVTYGNEDELRRLQSAVRRAEKDAAKTRAPVVAIDHSADNIKTLRYTYANHGNAQRAARSEWRRLQRGMAEFAITLAHGEPELTPELPATVDGFKEQINSTDWILTKITHTINDSGYTTQVALEIRATEIPG